MIKIKSSFLQDQCRNGTRQKMAKDELKTALLRLKEYQEDLE